jgi:hypothetical protein
MLAALEGYLELRKALADDTSRSTSGRGFHHLFHHNIGETGTPKVGRNDPRPGLQDQTGNREAAT